MTTTTSCRTCGESVPVGRFCAVCGQPLGDARAVDQPGDETGALTALSFSPTGAVTEAAPIGPSSPTQLLPMLPTLDAAGTPGQSAADPGASKPPRSSRSVGVATITAIVLAVGGYVIFNGTEAHTVTGDLSLSDSQFDGLTPGDSCQGANGYDDIGPGTEEIIEDETGKTLATGQLGDGVYDGASCVFRFTFTGVPRATFYRVHASGGRGVLQFPYHEMVQNHWAVHLTLGN